MPCNFSIAKKAALFVLPILTGCMGLPFNSFAAENQAKEAQFYEAVEKNDLAQVKALLESGVDPNARPPGKWLNETPLEYALSNDKLEMAELLLQFKADPLLEDNNKDTAFVFASDFPRMMELFRKYGLSMNTPNSEGTTPLLRIIPYASKERVLELLDAGANPSLADKDENTPLMLCASDKNMDVFRAILARKVDINAQNANGETALMKAVDSGVVDNAYKVAGLLIDAHADLEKKDWEGRTVLGQSVGFSKPDAALLLLDKGAKVDIKDNNGITPLMSAYDVKVITRLIAQGAPVKATANDGRTALHFYAGTTPYYAATLDETYKALQNTDWALNALLKAGADVNARDENGETPLQVASQKGAEPNIQILLKAGANINAANKKGFTALDFAVESGDAGKVALLLKAGATPHPTPGSEPAYLAALAGQADILKLLLGHGAAEKREDAGRLLLAALSGYQDNYNPTGRAECIRELMKQPVDVNVRDDTQMTPLMWAAAADMAEAVDLILQNGGEVTAKDNDGRDALSWAAATGAVHTIPILLAHGAKTDATDDQKRSAMDWAKIANQDKAMALLKTETR